LVSGIFNNNFTINLLSGVILQDMEGKNKNVEFNQIPQISLNIIDGEIADFSYTDSGYRVFDEEKNVAYGAFSSSIKIHSVVGDSDEITSRIDVKIREMEGFDVFDIYKNSFEKKIIDGIKIGNITIGGSSQEKEQEVVDTSSVVAPNPVPATVVQETVVATKEVVANPTAPVLEVVPPLASATAATPEVVTQNLPDVVTTSAETTTATNAEAVVTNQEVVPVQDVSNATPPVQAQNENKNVEQEPQVESVSDKIDQVLAQNKVLKSDLVIAIEYVLKPNNTDQAALPIDPAQMQVVATQYSRTFKVNIIELSNSLYKISLNGQIDYFQDDNLPSGFITAKIENVSKLIKHLQDGFYTMAMKDDVKLQSFDASNLGEISSDAYKNFLNKVADNLSIVTMEIAQRNQLSEGDVAVLDMRREKNLDFVINEISSREILGKF